MTFLEVKAVEKSYGTHKVLQKVDLSVNSHDVVCLIGASGSGKSTLLRCINALEGIDAGSIRIGGDPVHGPGVNLNAIRRQVGIVFQQFNLFPRMSVIDNLTLAPRKVLKISRSESRSRALDLLSQVGLAEKADDFPDRLSGGQQQRVAIARALAMEPKLLLLDEITSALDPEFVGEVLRIVRKLATEGMTLVIATHEMGFARDVAHRVCFLDNGTIYEEGPAEVMLTRPSGERTKLFLRSIIESGRL
jgi:polar amino acid transport system ATP-binding protein